MTTRKLAILLVLNIFCFATSRAQNVGIGTQSPNMKLVVRAFNDSMLLLLEDSSDQSINKTAGLYFKQSTDYTGAIKTIITEPGYARLGFYTSAATDPLLLRERMSITDGGLVGVGIVATNYQFELSGRMRIAYRIAAGRPAVVFNKADNTEAGMVGMVSDTSTGLGGLQVTPLVADFKNSRVGIGTPSAQYLLDVNGRARIRYNGATPGIWFNKSNNTEGAFIGMANDTIAGFWGNAINGAWQVAMDVKNARVGIGIAAPKAPLSFSNDIGNKISLWGDAAGNHYGFGIQGGLLQLYTDASTNDIAFGYGNSNAFTERMRIKGNGNVGIGSNTPTAKLEVNGQVKISGGTPGLGKVLTSDANGLASWTGPLAFKAVRSSSTTFSNNVPTIINFNSELYDTYNFYDNSFGQFYTDRAGIFHFDFNIKVTLLPGFVNDGLFTVAFLTNNIAVETISFKAVTGVSTYNISKSFDVQLAAGSNLYPRIANETGVTATVLSSESEFSGHVIK